MSRDLYLERREVLSQDLHDRRRDGDLPNARTGLQFGELELAVDVLQLAHNMQGVRFEVDLVDRQSCHLAEAQAAERRGQDHRPVERLDQTRLPHDLLDGEESHFTSFLRWEPHALRYVPSEPAIAHRRTEYLRQDHHMSTDRRR